MNFNNPPKTIDWIDGEFLWSADDRFQLVAIEDGTYELLDHVAEKTHKKFADIAAAKVKAEQILLKEFSALKFHWTTGDDVRIRQIGE